mmetsp:Transcript_87715/g.146305  ORF Transcript_87715/g.146305 Transcript_87715/m.146305 type:complete len:87 (-) Transcript_87715:59-319(-)
MCLHLKLQRHVLQHSLEPRMLEFYGTRTGGHPLCHSSDMIPFSIQFLPFVLHVCVACWSSKGSLACKDGLHLLVLTRLLCYNLTVA